MNSDAERLLEPALAYRSFYKDKFKQNAEDLFNELVKKSGINADENRATSDEYRKAQSAADEINKKIGSQNALRIFLIVLAVIAAVLLVVGIYYKNIWLIVIPPIVAIASLIPIFAVINPKIKELKKALEEATKKANELLEKAKRQIAPLLALFDSTMTLDLVQKALPTLVIDKQFEMSRYDYMNGKYGLCESYDNNYSVLGLISGEIIGNPFLVEKRLHHWMGRQTYSGYLTIHWTTYYTDSNGKRVAQHHTQTLHATVVKPKPFFKPETRLIYGNDAAPDLSFSHEKTHAERMSENRLKSFVKGEGKKIHKMAQKGVETGFTEMANVEFDAIFNGTERNNEVQFRLLFTPLAQKNLLDIMKGGSPYGDDFDFVKEKCLNYIMSEHSQNMDMDTDTSKYASYDIDICKEKFVSFNSNYFEGFYFDLAPLLSIPLYQQNKPREYIYKDVYPRNYTARESEVLANKLGYTNFIHPNSRTDAILKTKFNGKDDKTDVLTVTAYSYRTVHRVDYVSKLGGDGMIHQVPVPWIEYIPVSKETEMKLQASEISELEYRKKGIADAPNVYYHRLFATLGKIGAMTDVAPGEKDEGSVDYSDVKEDSSENN